MEGFNSAGSVDQLIALSVVVISLAAAYGKAFGPYQTTLAQWVIEAFAIQSRFRGLTNLGVGLVIGVGFSVMAAGMIGTRALVAVGIFAGFLASVEAGRRHDAESYGAIEFVTDLEDERTAGSGSGTRQSH